MKRKVVRVKRKALPENPSFTCSLSVRRNRDGSHVIPRFICSPNGKHHVIVDMETGDVAEGTSSSGYSFKEAKRIAKWFRKNKGTYTTTPF